MRAGIIDCGDRAGFWQASMGEAFECIVADDISGFPKCDILLISEEYCGGAIGRVIADIRASDKLCRVPAAAVTSDGSCENQEILLALGFDDIILLPVCGQLLLRRAQALAGMSPSGCPERGVSLERLMKLKDCECGAYSVCSDDFERVYRFALRMLERRGERAQVLQFSVEGGRSDETLRQMAADSLSRAVRTCLRRGDMASVCGGDKAVVLLMGADSEGGRLAADRIASGFYRDCVPEGFTLIYDIRAVR